MQLRARLGARRRHVRREMRSELQASKDDHRGSRARLWRLKGRILRGSDGTQTWRTYLAEGGAAVVLVLAPDGTVEFASRRLLDLTGYDLPSVVGRRWVEAFVPASSRASVAEALARGFGGVSLRGLVHPVLCKEGRDVLIDWLGSESLPGPGAGAEQRLVITGFDLTQTARERGLTKRNEQLMSSFLQGATDVMIVTDAKGTIQTFSAGAEDVFRCSRDDVIGRSIDHLLPSRFRKDHATQVAQFVGSDQTNLWMKARSEVRGLRMTGEEFAASATVTKVAVNGENLLLVILRDLSEEKVHEVALHNAKLRAEAASRAKSAFLATMSHEIRTPMNGVLGMLSVLEGTRLDEGQREMVESATNAGRMLMGILNDILDYSRIEAGRLRIDLVDFSVCDVLDRAVSLHAFEAKAAGVSLIVEIDPATPAHLIGDPLRIQQVLHNLVGNAVKFTGSGWIRVRCGYLASAGANGVLQLEIEDTGIGMTEAAVAVAFDSFTQADSSITRTYGGSGLGLSIVKGLVEAMGGSVDVESCPGLGTCFSVRLPMLRHEDVEVSSGVRPGSRAVQHSFSLRVLVAEDHAVNARVLQLLLERKGVTATLADNGAKAVELFAPGEFDLVILDIQMPVLGGESALVAMRQLERGTAGRPAYIIACTADADPLRVERYRRLGFDDVLTKPVAPDALDQVLEAAANRQS